MKVTGVKPTASQRAGAVLLREGGRGLQAALQFTAGCGCEPAVQQWLNNGLIFEAEVTCPCPHLGSTFLDLH